MVRMFREYLLRLGNLRVRPFIFQRRVSICKPSFFCSQPECPPTPDRCKSSSANLCHTCHSQINSVFSVVSAVTPECHRFISLKLWCHGHRLLMNAPVIPHRNPSETISRRLQY